MISTHDTLSKIAAIQRSNPDNIAIQCFDTAYFQSLSPALQDRLLFCINSGIEIPESEMGCYAGHPSDYDDLAPFFAKVISRHHGVSESATHDLGWIAQDKSDGRTDDHHPAAADVQNLGVAPCSMRIRVGRNFSDLPLTSAMDQTDRLRLEQRMVSVFETIPDNNPLAGTYHSLTPGHAHAISAQQQQDMIRDHLLFKPMDGDRYLSAAGISHNWPHGRGCYVSHDREFIIWVGEEDHLRIMTMTIGTQLGQLLSRLKPFIDTIDLMDSFDFATSSDYGFVTTCPTNLGTGMRASVHLRLPNLTADGGDQKVKDIASPLGLAVRGLGGEHTPIGADGTVDVSPRARFGISEEGIIQRLYDGIAALKTAEDQAAR